MEVITSEQLANPTPCVELRGVSKGYREGERRHEVLVDVDARVLQREIVVLLGRSGSGKSTVLNLVSGIDLPDRGDVLVDGRAINRMTERERTLLRRNHVGFVFQFFNLIPTLTVLENLLLPLERVGLADRASSYPDKLSGGEQQRVAVARALVHDPRLVLADEPTGNLDLETGRNVLGLLDTLVRGAGKTMIMVTHSREVIGVADRLMTLRDGRLVEIDHGELT